MNTTELYLEAQDLNQQATTLIQVGKIEEAKEKLDKAIEIEPMLMDSYKNYGDIYMMLDDYTAAKNAYKKARLIEKQPVLHFLYGNACFMNDEYAEGIESYNLAISEGYASDEMLFFMGLAYEHLNDDDMALRYFQKACIKNPARPDYDVKKIGTLLRLDMIESAEKSVDELIAKAPELFDALHIKTQILIQQKKFEEAGAFSKAAAEKFPEDTELLLDYARALVLNQKVDESLQVISSAKSMKYFDDAKRDFIMLEAQIHAEFNRVQEAIEGCRECISLESDEFFDSEARFMLMNLYVGNESFEEALEQATEIVTKEEKDSFYYAALYYRPFCLRKLSKEDEAKKFFKEANSFYRIATLKDPAAVDAYLYRSMCMRDLEDYDKALELLDFIINIGGESAEIYMIKADVYNLQGRKSLKEEALKKAYDLKPELKPNDESIGE